MILFSQNRSSNINSNTMFDNNMLMLMNSVIGKGEWVLMSANKSRVFIERSVMKTYSMMMQAIFDTIFASSYTVFTCLMTVLAYFNSM